MSIRSVVVLAVAAFGLATLRPPDAFGGCAPGCKICLLDVCSEVGPQSPAERKSGSGQKSPPGPISYDPAVNLDNKLKGLNPGDTSGPVTEWAGFSKRDFVLSFLFDFVMIGNCQSATCASKSITATQAKLRKRDISDEQRDSLRKRETELRKELAEAEGSIRKYKYDCKSVKSYCFID